MRLGPLGAPEIIIILILVLLVFGAKRLPEMARGIGQSVREFRKGIRDMKDDIEKDDEDDDKEVKKAKVKQASAPERDSHEAARTELREEQGKPDAVSEPVTVEQEKEKVSV